MGPLYYTGVFLTQSLVSSFKGDVNFNKKSFLKRKGSVAKTI